MKNNYLRLTLIIFSIFTLNINMVPDPKEEKDKITKIQCSDNEDRDAIEIFCDNISYKLAALKLESSRLIVDVEIMNNSNSQIEVNPRDFHASMSGYVLRYIPLEEILANYIRYIDIENLHYQSKLQKAEILSKSYNLKSETNYYGNKSVTKSNIRQDPYSQLGQAIAIKKASEEMEENIRKNYAIAQEYINTTLDYTILLPQTRCNGRIYFDCKNYEGPVRIDLVTGENILKFHFKDSNIPYYGVSESDSSVINSLSIFGSLYNAGLRKGDKIISIDGKPVSSINEFLDIGKDYKVGQTVEIEYKKKWTNKTIKVQMKLLPNYP